MNKIIYIIIMMAVFLEASTDNDYFSGTDPSRATQVTDVVNIGGYIVSIGSLTNYISEDVVEDALEQYDTTLNKGRKKVTDAIDSLQKELQRLEDAYRKIDIVTKRLDTIRQLNMITSFSVTHKIKQERELDAKIISLNALSQNNRIFLLESEISKSALQEKVK